MLVHDTAIELLNAIRKKWPNIQIDRNAVAFGAATHDIGKTAFPSEITGPGHQHERQGPALLESHGVTPALARFARTHGTWPTEPGIILEDLLVALADSIWKGARQVDLETKTAEELAALTGLETWRVFIDLDAILERIGRNADARLDFQRASTG